MTEFFFTPLPHKSLAISGVYIHIVERLTALSFNFHIHMYQYETSRNRVQHTINSTFVLERVVFSVIMLIK